MTDLVALSETRDYQRLFIDALNWSAPDHGAVTITLDDENGGRKVTASNAASYKGLRVWEVPEVLGNKDQAVVDRALGKTTTNRLVIFHDPDTQVWQWPSKSSRGTGVVSRPARHRHKTGSTDAGFAAKLEAIALPVETSLGVNDVLTKVRTAFDVETKHETRRASKLMVRMYEAVEAGYSSGVPAHQRDHEISVSLARILFLLFGDDTEMWSTELFQDFIKDHTARDGSDIGQKINTLFEVLDTPYGARAGYSDALLEFPYVNGGIFDERITLPQLNSDFREAVLDASAVDWSTISPAIFGSMFQSVRDARTRRELGEHYTSEENILKTLNPLFLDELRDEYQEALKRDTDRKKVNALNKLWDKLGELRYMDPACGCGNFIIVAYRELRALELEIMLALQDLSGETQLSFDPTLELKVSLNHFYGIEIDEWPARIAETAMFLIDRQCDLRLKERFGDAPQRLPIQRQAQIVVGNALRMDWANLLPPSESVIIAGNPPFVGPKERSKTQTEDLKQVWGKQYDGFLDYVSGWYAKSIDYFDGLASRWAFVSTNSVAQGQAVPTLWGWIFQSGWRIRFAHRTFPWTSEAAGGAAVHCVVIGFDRDLSNPPRLFDYIAGVPVSATGEAVTQINAYLVDGPNVLVRKRMRPAAAQLPEVQAGSKAVDWGFLTVEVDDYEEVAGDSIAARYLRPYRGGDELINGLDRWCLWFVGADLDELMESPILRARLEEVRRRREVSTKLPTRRGASTPHLFEERRQPDVEYLGIPQTFTENRSHATVARLSPDVIASIKLFTSPDPDGFLFAIISSSMFMTWQKAVGGRMKSDPSFTNTIVWNTLPLPPVAPDQKAEIIAAGRDVQAVRDKTPELSLGKQYDPRSMRTELVDAHERLDALVCQAFGANGLLESRRDRQRLLFERFEKQERRG